MADSSIVENSALQVTFLVTFLMASAVGVKFSIDRQVDQIFRIITAEPSMETSDLKMVMTPADFNFLIPFNVKMACGVGSMVPHDMRRVHEEDVYMDAINENETFINIRFTVSEIDFKWELCWLSLVIPVPMWLRGKILQSTYHMNAKVTYQPNCTLTVPK
uniref:Putative tyrosine-protein phosphatase cdc-14 n=1 Tax=Lygus hesperus TaxID=30085 RepID=A0A0A9X122_LYGHE